MNETETIGDAQTTAQSVAADSANPQPDTAVAARSRQQERQEARRWWIKLIVQPALVLACGVIVIVALGIAQRMGFISAGSGGGGDQASASSGDTRTYICPMMCTPPQIGPGRCPVCAMELVPSTSGGGGDSRSVQIDPAARRVANIHTVAVMSTPMTRTIRAIGELSYDEGTLKTLSAYVDGRLDQLYADYTGVVVEEGDHLALVYSPRLYSGQVELLLAKKAREDSRSATLTRVIESSRNLYESSRQRLIELGMTAPQIEQLEETGQANSRLQLCAPISGTVIEKLADEGQYVKEGQAIYRLADLSTVWLMLELFPEEAATIRNGQEVTAAVQSLPGQKFTGHVAFIDPNVDPKTRTVGVRVVISNEDGHLRVGDYAKATIEVPLTPQSSADGQALVVPRDAVLMAGSNSVLYVETEPGRFEIRRIVLGPSCGDQIVILEGVAEGEQVATRGNFLIDSQMQLAGNPSLIDPTKAEPKLDEAMSAEMIAALSELPTEDRGLAESQRICPVTMMQLGSMGTPQKVDVDGTPVFICCEGCREDLLNDPETYLAILADADAAESTPENAPSLDLPPIGVPQAVEPQGNLPPIEAPQAITERSTDIKSAGERPTRQVTGQRGEVVR